MSQNAGAGADRKAIAASHLPGDSDVWVFVLGDMLIFSAYFGAYMFDRGRNQELFLHSQRQLSPGLGAANTLVLLASSLFVALCVQAARRGERGAASRCLILGGACGAGFVLIKLCEWYLKLSTGVGIATNSFFMHYYVLTGVHCFHVLLGLGILCLVWRELHGAQPPRMRILEIGATYWHMVDLLWILIFALLYLMR